MYIIILSLKYCDSYFVSFVSQCCSIQLRQSVCEQGRTRALLNTFAHSGHRVISSRLFAPNGLEQVAILLQPHTQQLEQQYEIMAF